MKNSRRFEIYTKRNGNARWKGVYAWSNGEIYGAERSEGLKHGYSMWRRNLENHKIGE